MQALILAAGLGRRFQPLVTHKPFFPFAGKTLLERVINNLKLIGVTKPIIVVREEDKAKIKGYQTVIQKEATGMAGAVLAARKVLAGSTVIVNGDDLIDIQILKQFQQAVKNQPDKICLTGLKSENNLPGGYFSLRGPTLQVVEKPAEGKRPSDWLKLVLDYFPKIEDFIDKCSAIFSDKDDVYEQELNNFKDLTLFKAKGEFQQLKTNWQVLDMTKLILKYELKPTIDKTAKIFPGAHIINSYIGPKVVIGHHCLIRDSIIESGTIVGYHTEIARSYIGPNNNFHTNYVGDSIIEAECNLGSGARLANMRFDKKEVIPGRSKLGAVMAWGSQLGINVSVMPGITIGEKAIVGSGVVLTHSLEAGEFKKN
jgi:NDP-sugar pyrophosphorylase family protein